MWEKYLLIIGRLVGLGFTSNSPWSEPYYFVVIADTQLGMIEDYLEHKPSPKWDRDLALSVRAIDVINKMGPQRPRFVVICGDLVHAFPGVDTKIAQESDLINAYNRVHSDIPVVYLAGNHDVGNVIATPALDAYVQRFGDDYFSYTHAGIRYLVLNSQFFMPIEAEPSIKRAQERFFTWLRSETERLREDVDAGRAKYGIVFQHIPWFLKEPREADEYFNLPLALRDEWLPLLRRAGIRAIFCGHYHRNAGGAYDDRMEVIVQTALGATLGNDKAGVRIVRVREDRVEHEYFALDDIPTTITL